MAAHVCDRLRAMCAPPKISGRDFLRYVYCTFFGFIKGVVMAPVIIPLHVVSCAFISLLMMFTFVDQGYFTLRFTKYIGFNLKCVLALLLPVLVLLFVASIIAASALFSISFVLAYPIFVTLHAKQQTGYRYAYFYTAWWETGDVTLANIQAYWGFCTVWVPGQLRAIRTSPHENPFDIHPYNFALALLVYLFGWAAVSLAVLAIVTVKFIPMLLRAYVNHVIAAPSWGPFPWSKGWKCWFSPAYWVIYLALPVAAVMMFPAALVYGSYIAAAAAADTVNQRGALAPAAARIKAAVALVHKETTKYILRQDVPFLVLQSSTPVSLPWLVAGLLPALVALVVVPVLTTLVALISIVPVMFASFANASHMLCYTGKSPKPFMVPVLVLGIIALPAIVPIGLCLVVLWATLQTPRAMLRTHTARSLSEGFAFIPGIVYRTEYFLNKYAYANTAAETVHWASCFPPSWARHAKPLMDPKEFERTDSGFPVSVVGAPARYVPRGMRRPKLDAATGKEVDMTVAGYVIPGVGFARVGANGALQPVGAQKGEGGDHTALSMEGLPDPGVSGSVRGFLGRYYAPAGPAAEAAQKLGGPGGAAAHHKSAHGLKSIPPAKLQQGVTIKTVAAVAGPSGSFCMCLSSTPDEEADPSVQPSSPVREAAAPAGADPGASTTPPAAAAADASSSSSGGGDAASAIGAGAAVAGIPAPPEPVIPAGFSEGGPGLEVSNSSSIPSPLAATATAFSTPAPAPQGPSAAGSSIRGPAAVTAARSKAAAALARAQEALGRAHASPPPPVIAVPISAATGPGGVGVGGSLMAATRGGPLDSAPSAAAPQPHTEGLLPYRSSAAAATVFAAQAQQQSVAASPARPQSPAAAQAQPGLGAGGVILEVDDDEEEEGEDGGDEEDEEDDEEVFVLMPVTHPELPDTWVKAYAADGELYYINYARGQSSWQLPPGA